MSKPDYRTLLTQIADEDDPVRKQELIDECYRFPEILTEEEEDLFNYCSGGYVEPNPGYDNAYKSYVGKYFSDDGETTQ